MGFDTVEQGRFVLCLLKYNQRVMLSKMVRRFGTPKPTPTSIEECLSPPTASCLPSIFYRGTATLA